jgi:hypothetical protein
MMSVSMKARWTVGCGAVLLAGSCAFVGNAMAQQRVPNDDELHSMYCVEVIRAEITLQQHLISASNEAAGTAQPESREQWIATSAELLQQLAKLEEVLHQLQAYMLPRIPAVDSLALASEIRHAEADIEDSRTISETCAGECGEPARAANPPQPRTDSSWTHAALLIRVRGCENPTWTSL